MNYIDTYSAFNGEALLLFAPEWQGTKIKCSWWLSFTEIDTKTPVIVGQKTYILETPITETHILKNESITLNYHAS